MADGFCFPYRHSLHSGSPRWCLGRVLAAALLSLTLAACASEPSDDATVGEGLPPHSPGVDPGSAPNDTAAAADDLFGDEGFMTPEEMRDDARDPRREHVIALIVPLSGQHADAGQALLDGAQMAFFDLRNQEAVLRPFDSGGTPDGAARAMSQALEAGAGLVIGPLLAQSVEAIRPMAERAGVPVISFSNSPDVAGPPVYLAGYAPPAQVARAIGNAVAEGRTRIAVLAPSGAYGDAVISAAQDVVDSYRRGDRQVPPGIASAIESGRLDGTSTTRTAPAAAADVVPGLTPTREAPPAPVDLARVAYYDPGAPDHSEVIQSFSNYRQRVQALERQRGQLAAKGDEASKAALRRLENLDTLGDPPFDAVLLPALNAQSLKILAAQLAYYDVDEPAVRLLGLQPWDGFGDLSGEPTLIGSRYVATPDSYRKRFGERFAATFGQRPSRLASLGYDVAAVAVSLAARGEEPARFNAEAITNPTGFIGAEGLFRFTSDGLNERGLAVIQITPEGRRTIDPAPESFPQDPVVGGGETSPPLEEPVPSS
ncbi:penicillin-binding protein activator [Marivibrio halodurans]|uniref:Penicillin-binding protein activator n=1 Tax=Marivibrio halodurans TaxID=2039722 RepID=A0A8J7S585_9PROT|nr:penicillin-binding protein activator [Marivibrio halodurans]MBP5858763.1 penicillin-binding protein activator [Marivibrio halodurans]